LLEDGHYVVPRRANEPGDSMAQVLVELEVQRVVSAGSSTYRSRDIAEP
jgi:hypothetical protein